MYFRQMGVKCVFMTHDALKTLLDAQMQARNRADAISYDRPDPMLVARRRPEPYRVLVCALFAYGRADLIVRFLDSLDLDLLDADEGTIRAAFASHYYRFQNGGDVTALFLALSRFKRHDDIYARFLAGYQKGRKVTDGLNAVIATLQALYPRESRGYRFLIGSEITRLKGGAPMKRWLMFLRWMVRHDAIDFGLWPAVDPADLIIPLDTHTFSVSRRLGLLSRRTYDLQAAVELTEALRAFDPADPVKYDFALYRLGQERAEF